jgi:DNA adenine methylase
MTSQRLRNVSKTKTVVPWPGGKTRLLQHLLPLLSDNPHTCYVEAFAGGAALLFAREPAKVEVLNDMHGELVRLYRVLAHHLDEFMRQFRWALTSREMFRWAQMQRVEPLTDIQRAARFYYLQRHAFGAKVAGQSFGTSHQAPKTLNLLRLEEELSSAHLRLHHVVVEQLPWQECVARYDAPHTLFLLDPPYWKTEGYGTPFGIEQYDELATVMASLKGRAILTINDHPDMRARFDRFGGKTVPIRYTVGGGAGAARRERIYVSGKGRR